jgi:hypothetical protein
MVKDIVQSPANKNSQRIIKLATEILELLNEHIDSECPHCRRFLSQICEHSQVSSAPEDDNTRPALQGTSEG